MKEIMKRMSYSLLAGILMLMGSCSAFDDEYLAICPEDQPQAWFYVFRVTDSQGRNLIDTEQPDNLFYRMNVVVNDSLTLHPFNTSEGNDLPPGENAEPDYSQFLFGRANPGFLVDGKGEALVLSMPNPYRWENQERYDDLADCMTRFVVNYDDLYPADTVDVNALDHSVYVNGKRIDTGTGQMNTEGSTFNFVHPYEFVK